MHQTLCSWSYGFTAGVSARVLAGVLWQGWWLLPPRRRRRGA